MNIIRVISRGKTLFGQELLLLMKNPVFIFITFIGNSTILTGALFFYLFEVEPNDRVNSFFDALYWSFATITTVGYGDVFAVTVGGRIVSILMMLIGTALFWTYAALFASVILNYNKVSDVRQSPQ